ncbi:Zinc finger C3HC4 type (RING finger) protein [Lotmaria passim]
MASTSAPTADFSCAICFDTATEPVVTRCGHLFCWECLDHWLHSASGAPECPVCKGRVDEHIAGDIIPLYGKGKQSTREPDGRSEAVTATASTTTTAAAATTPATADPGQEAFFSRPSAYSFAPGRESRRAAAATQAAPQTQSEEHHPRPSADRAPPRPRPPQQQDQHMQMHLHNHGMPLTVGSSVFFFGGGGGMLLSLVLIIAWAVYNYAPWREWRGDFTRWYHQIRGHPVADERRDGSAPHANAPAPNRNAHDAAPSGATATDAVAVAAADPNGLPPQQVMLRNLIFSLLAVFVLFQLLLFM